MPKFLRGAIPTSRARLSAAVPHQIVGATPPQMLWFPKQLSMWGNAQFGLCVTAEEAFAKACHDPEIFIPAHKVITWARKNYVLNGAGLWEVMELMQACGFDQDGVTYDDRPFKAVNWTNEAVLQNAISQGPVKIGVAADQLQDVPDIGEQNGWVATGFTEDQNLDHCTSLCGYGTFAWLAGQLGAVVPSDIEGATPALAMFTWSSIGIIDVPSMLAITGEAWLRTPTTAEKADA